jgi:predicted DNA-binding transcriptional regulator YafY
MTLEEDGFDLGDEAPPIPKITVKERRTLELFFNLLKYSNGISFDKIRRLMPEHYSNENIESDQRKLRRDIDVLESQGMTIKFYADNFSGEKNIYKLIQSPLGKDIKFTDKELVSLSVLVAKEMDLNYSEDLWTASQKIFNKNIQYYPKLKKYTESETSILEISQENRIFLSLLKAVKDKKPIKILYYKDSIEDKKERIIDPLLILKRNSTDFYLLGYDHEKKSKRRFIIPKILKISEVEGDPIKNSSYVTKEDLNHHSLAFKIHEPIEISFICEPSSIWKLFNYLNPHPFEVKGNTITLTTTHLSAIYPFVIKENDVIISTNSSEFQQGLIHYIHELKNLYATYSNDSLLDHFK